VHGGNRYYSDITKDRKKIEKRLPIELSLLEIALSQGIKPYLRHELLMWGLESEWSRMVGSYLPKSLLQRLQHILRSEGSLQIRLIRALRYILRYILLRF